MDRTTELLRKHFWNIEDAGSILQDVLNAMADDIEAVEPHASNEISTLRSAAEIASLHIGQLQL